MFLECLELIDKWIFFFKKNSKTCKTQVEHKLLRIFLYVGEATLAIRSWKTEFTKVNNFLHQSHENLIKTSNYDWVLPLEFHYNEISFVQCVFCALYIITQAFHWILQSSSVAIEPLLFEEMT